MAPRSARAEGVRASYPASLPDLRDNERFDVKYVLMTNELAVEAEELSCWGDYRDMWRVERAFCFLKSVLRIEPVYHRRDRRIMAHAHLCVLAYLLMRLAENRTGESWPLMREKVARVSVARIETDHAAIFRLKSSGSPTPKEPCGIRAASRPPPETLQVTA